jgi:hypothetical protein
VSDEIAKTDPTIRWILAASPKAEYTLSVCNGAFWLANAGLLDGKEATTFYGLIEHLRTKFPNIRVVNDKRYCDNGRIITTAGLSSGLDGALHVVEKLDGVGKARSVAFQMEYNWQPDSGYARGALADRFLRTAGNASGRISLPDGTKTKVVDQSGTRDRWDEVWQIDGPSVTPRSLLEAASAIAPKTWNPATDGEADRQAWSFPDETGSTWTATFRVEPDTKVHDRYLLRVALRKGA